MIIGFRYKYEHFRIWVISYSYGSKLKFDIFIFWGLFGDLSTTLADWWAAVCWRNQWSIDSPMLFVTLAVPLIICFVQRVNVNGAAPLPQDGFCRHFLVGTSFYQKTLTPPYQCTALLSSLSCAILGVIPPRLGHQTLVCYLAGCSRWGWYLDGCINNPSFLTSKLQHTDLRPSLTMQSAKKLGVTEKESVMIGISLNNCLINDVIRQRNYWHY